MTFSRFPKLAFNKKERKINLKFEKNSFSGGLKTQVTPADDLIYDVAVLTSSSDAESWHLTCVQLFFVPREMSTLLACEARFLIFQCPMLIGCFLFIFTAGDTEGESASKVLLPSDYSTLKSIGLKLWVLDLRLESHQVKII